MYVYVRCVQGHEAGQLHAGRAGPHKTDRLRNVPRRTVRPGRDHEDLLRHARLHRSRSTALSLSHYTSASTSLPLLHLFSTLSSFFLSFIHSLVLIRSRSHSLSSILCTYTRSLGTFLDSLIKKILKGRSSLFHLWNLFK